MRAKSELIRRFIIEHVEDHPHDVGSLVSDEFQITRQAFNRHMRMLIEDEIIEAKGTTRERTYRLRVASHSFEFLLADHPDEDRVWRESVASLLEGVPENVINICHYGFTEMLNNAIEHSAGTTARVVVDLTAKSISLLIADDGVGVFEKLKTAYHLVDLHAAMLELSKGKFTTDSDRHSGQGIFFTSRMFNTFMLISNNVAFSHYQDEGKDDWIFETDARRDPGTLVSMSIGMRSARTIQEVFDKFAVPESDAFLRTHVALSLARYHKENLISRSQAKRVLSRLDRFEEVVLDFDGIDMIGQAFADEIFRVYRNAHPEVKIIAINAGDDVARMIRRAQSPGSRPSSPDDFGQAGASGA